VDALVPWILGLTICTGLLVWLGVAFVRVLRGAVRRGDDLGDDTDPGSRTRDG